MAKEKEEKVTSEKESEKNSEKEDKTLNYIIYIILAAIIIFAVYFFFFKAKCGDNKCSLDETFETCKQDCANCDDGNICTKDSFNYESQKCVNQQMTSCCGNNICEIDSEDFETCEQDCSNCEDNNICTTDSYDYEAQSCTNKKITPCCGNNVCDEGEEYNSCSNDCVISTTSLNKNVIYQADTDHTYIFDNRVIKIQSIEPRASTINVIYNNESVTERVYEGSKQDFLGIKVEIYNNYINEKENKSYSKIRLS